MSTPQREVRKRKRRESASSYKRSWVAWVLPLLAVVVVLVAIVIATVWISARIEDNAIRDTVDRGEMVIVGVDLSWNLQSDSFTANVHLLNTGEVAIEGKLVFEINPETDRLSRTFIDQVLAERSVADRQQLRASLERAPKLKAKDRALLAFLARGGIADSPNYETIPFVEGERPQDLSFRKTTPILKIDPDQLAKVVVSQDLPHSRMGEHVSVDSIRLIGIQL